MEQILITNNSFFDKEYFKTFVNQEEYKFFGVHNGKSTLVPFYQELFRKVIGNNVDNKFQDRALKSSETQQIKIIFENELDKTIPKIEIHKNKFPHFRLEWKGKTYDLNLSLFSPNNRRIADFHKIIDICEECLKESKPMYLSIQ